MTKQRCNEIIRLADWHSTGCRGRKPDVPALTAEEDRIIRQRWMNMTGRGSWLAAVYELRDGG